MLFRRIDQHVKAQNWFAVLIDFFIVVLGVFMGLQVSNWNENRQDRADERKLLERLSVETQDLQAVRRAERTSYEKTAEQLVDIWTQILAKPDGEPLTGAHCLAVLTSHIVTKPTDETPSLGEAVSGGKMSLIQNQDIETALRRLILSQENQRVRFEELAGDPFRLGHLYPELFPVISAPPNQELPPSFDGPVSRLVDNGCNLDAMRASERFKNTFLDNSMRVEALAASYRDFDADLEALQRALKSHFDRNERKK